MKFRYWCLTLVPAILGACVAGGEAQRDAHGDALRMPATRSAASCPPPGTDRAALEALRDRQFTIAEDARRNALALELLECLGHPDPFLRDDIAYTGLAAMMRRDEITHETARQMLERLTKLLLQDTADDDGFRRPFAALVLAEVARMDRIDPFLSPPEREGLVRTAKNYLAGVWDYRGFSDSEGWRHGVAHGADLVLQLSLNERVDANGLQTLLGAVFGQVVPSSGHSYRFGEAQRLARPVLFAAQRGLIEEATWVAWFDALINPAPFKDWASTYRSQSGLARIHNTRAFAYELEVRLKRNPQIDFGALTEQVDRLITALP